MNRRHASATDPEATIVRRGGKARLKYQTHRSVDDRAEVITACEVTGGDVSEAHRMVALMEAHQANTGRRARVVVADSKYGTTENILACRDRGARPHIKSLKAAQDEAKAKKGVLAELAFRYEAASDSYVCPAGQRLVLKSRHAARASMDYAAPKGACQACAPRARCTRNAQGRTIKRHLRQDDLDAMRRIAASPAASRDLATRQHLMERSFARGQRLGMKRARWRGRDKVAIQEYRTAGIQNILTLIRHGRHAHPGAARAAPLRVPTTAARRPCLLLLPGPGRSPGTYTSGR